MKKLEVFFDYTCPYCYRGHQALKELLIRYPDIQPEWMPCESHPRPEVASLYSDLASAVLYYLKDVGGDEKRYNDAVFAAHFEEKGRIDDPALLTKIDVACGGKTEEIEAAIAPGKYLDMVAHCNRLTWETLGFEAVPSYRCEGKTAGSAGGRLLSGEALAAIF